MKKIISTIVLVICLSFTTQAANHELNKDTIYSVSGEASDEASDEASGEASGEVSGETSDKVSGETSDKVSDETSDVSKIEQAEKIIGVERSTHVIYLIKEEVMNLKKDDLIKKISLSNIIDVEGIENISPVKGVYEIIVITQNERYIFNVFVDYKNPHISTENANTTDNNTKESINNNEKEVMGENSEKNQDISLTEEEVLVETGRLSLMSIFVFSGVLMVVSLIAIYMGCRKKMTL